MFGRILTSILFFWSDLAEMFLCLSMVEIWSEAYGLSKDFMEQGKTRWSKNFKEERKVRFGIYLLLMGQMPISSSEVRSEPMCQYEEACRYIQ